MSQTPRATPDLHGSKRSCRLHDDSVNEVSRAPTYDLQCDGNAGHAVGTTVQLFPRGDSATAKRRTELIDTSKL